MRLLKAFHKAVMRLWSLPALRVRSATGSVRAQANIAASFAKSATDELAELTEDLELY